MYELLYLEFMSKENEDDAKAFRIISKIYDFLLLHHGVNWREFNVRWKSSMAVKKALADKVTYTSTSVDINF